VTLAKVAPRIPSDSRSDNLPNALHQVSGGVYMQSMAAPPRRTAPSIARLNQASIEYWKAENQKLRDRNASLHRRLHKYKKYPQV